MNSQSPRSIVLSVCGSLQKSSSNGRLLGEAEVLSANEWQWLHSDLLRELPLFNPDLAGSALPAVDAWRAQLKASDAILIASPEYGHSLPGALKNAIDWVIGSGELHHKPVAITCAAAAAGRGERGLAALAQTLRAADAHVLWDAPILANRKAEQLAELLRVLATGVANV